MKDRLNLRKFADKDYRDGFLQATVRGWIAYQVQAIREGLGFTQAEFAEKIGTTQSVVSRTESDKKAPNVQTLLEMATELDMALVVQFVSYPEFLTRTEIMSAAALKPPTIYESLSAPIALGVATSALRAWQHVDAEQLPKTDLNALLMRRSEVASLGPQFWKPPPQVVSHEMRP